MRAWLLVPWAWRIMKKMKPPMIRSGSTAVSSRPSHDVSGAGVAAKMSAGSFAPVVVAARLHVAEDVGQDARHVRPCSPVPGGATSTLSVVPCWVTCVTLPAADVREELAVADRCAWWTIWEIQVNSSAAVPTTSTSITMPLRKNFGFNGSLRGEASDDRAPSRGASIASGSMTTP